MPDVVTGLLLTEKIEGMLKSTLVTVPVPAPIAVLKLAAFKVETVLSALNLGNVFSV